MSKTMKTGFALLLRFLGNRRGNVAMMFGLCLVPVTIAAGVGLDYVRAAMVKSAMSEALDSAALAVGSTKGLDKDKAKALAEKFFTANYKGDGTPVLTIADGGYVSTGSVTITANVTMDTTLMKVAGIKTVPVSTSATVVWGQSKLWVSLVLDNSGSMSKGDSTGSKMDALKNASVQLLTILQAAATSNGDVKVSIVPFDRNVNLDKTNVSASWIDWTDWDAAPANVTIASSIGPGSPCPFTTGSNNQKSPYGFYCVASATNGASKVSTIPTSGLICPGMDSGDYNTAHRDRYYNGCWDSVIKQTSTATKTDTTPITTKQTCSQTGSGTITCNNQNNYPSNGTTTSSTATVVSSGYTGDSTTTSTNTATKSTTDGTSSCSGSGSKKKCTWTRTILQTKTDTTVTKTAYGGYIHTWIVNDHATWQGCIMDRVQDYDVKNTAPTGTAKFPAENKSSCLGASAASNGDYATVMKLSYDWTALTKRINAMNPNGSTNQPIGMAHGWQSLTNTDPYNPGALPSNTTRYIILLSDGLNTQDRWWGDGSTEGTTEDGYIDDRMDKVCDAAKADGVIVYTIFLHVGTNGNSAPLQNCATDSTKYFDLTSTSAVVTTFNQIAQQITNVRVSK